jgi:peptidoglycan/xylan/chitin deacetylase (PgdA/CDA1 family)
VSTNERDALVQGSPPRGALPWLKSAVKRGLSESAFLLGTVIRVSTAEPVLALTFDDGPHPEDTPPLLDLLDRYGAKATFFVVGKSARNHPELIERMAAAGHALGNHTWDHLSLPSLKGPFRRRQLAWTQEVLGPHSSGLFRPPYGEQSLGSRLDALSQGLTVVCWDVIAEDWRDDPAEVMLARIYRRLRRGSIVLFHDTLYTTVDERFRDRRPTLATVERLLQDLGDRYRFVTVPELMRLGRPVRWHWYQRSRLDWLKQVV